VVPLKRLLRRAILANLSGGDFAEGKKGVSAAMAEAKKEKVPDYQTWEHYVFSSSYNAKDYILRNGIKIIHTLIIIHQ